MQRLNHLASSGQVLVRNWFSVLAVTMPRVSRSDDSAHSTIHDTSADARRILAAQGLKIVGLMTHYPTEDLDDMGRQLASFHGDCDWLRGEGLNLHFSQSATRLQALGLFTTNPSQPALLAPLAGQLAQATGWRIEAALMTMVIGFSLMILPYQAPPVMVGMQVAGVTLRQILRLTLPLAAVCIFVLMPLDFLWWRWLGYFR